VLADNFKMGEEGYSRKFTKAGEPSSWQDATSIYFEHILQQALGAANRCHWALAAAHEHCSFVILLCICSGEPQNACTPVVCHFPVLLLLLLQTTLG
jgi:hypothetical protein